jgi:hypothetical protein
LYVVVALLKKQDDLVNDLKWVDGRLINELIKILTENIDIKFLTLGKKEHLRSKSEKKHQELV